MEILKAILFGIVEGVTEWLPVSSTGHMILLDEFIKLNVSDEFYELFSVVIQLAAIIAVIVFYFKDIFPWGPNKSKEDTKKIFNLWGKVLVACVPAGVIGILFDDLLDKYLYNGIVVALTLIIYGVIFIVMENKGFGDKHTKSMDDITYKQAFEVGAFQVLALIPGTSRSGATIIGGLISGLDRKTIANFTFILAIPVMFGASLVKLLKYIKNVGLAFTSSELSILIVGSIVAFVVSLFIIKFLIGYVRKHDFKVFGYYRIVLGIIVLLYFAVKLLA
ncbi:MAG TPA: undecaprenyl-diphosphate phosphatase [Bacilli bacterium]|jgi:undecaprenyl-diphosphatase|nr:undecaprenyl-diphosphate phosphatase [Bacilli bacterium]HQC83949.1 undecaprenyl-diphosphate phosphatase [Bacilli bacterium]